MYTAIGIKLSLINPCKLRSAFVPLEIFNRPKFPSTILCIFEYGEIKPLRSAINLADTNSSDARLFPGDRRIRTARIFLIKLLGIPKYVQPVIDRKLLFIFFFSPDPRSCHNARPAPYYLITVVLYDLPSIKRVLAMLTYNQTVYEINTVDCGIIITLS